MQADNWAVDVLKTLKAPATPQNIKYLTAWQRWEGGHTNNKATWNWLNTTHGKQFPSINSVGVRAFPDYRTGIAYTADTIIGGYPGIVQGLRAGNPYAPKLRPMVAGDLSKWVSGSRTARPDYASKVLGTKVTLGGAAPATRFQAPTLAPAAPKAAPGTLGRSGLTLESLAGALDDGSDFWNLVQANPIQMPEMAAPISAPQEIAPALDMPKGKGGNIQKAISIAKQQIGKPYIWGGESPKEGGFDCSGLIDFAFRKAGIDLPVGRLTTYNAIKLGRSVKGQKLLPGDWVISNGGEHMTMYIGNGKVIAAPHRGTNVQIQKVPNDIVDVRRYRGPKA